MNELEKRALAAYYRHGGSSYSITPSHEQHDNKEYVVLRDTHKVIACYRVRNDGKLKRLRRMPTTI